MTKPLLEVRGQEMKNPRYSILLWPYLLGQWRIQLCRSSKPHPDDPDEHGDIIRQCCTYIPEKALETCYQLQDSEDPEAFLQSLERPWNCEMPRIGRIRLDNAEPGIPRSFK